MSNNIICRPFQSRETIPLSEEYLFIPEYFQYTLHALTTIMKLFIVLCLAAATLAHPVDNPKVRRHGTECEIKFSKVFVNASLKLPFRMQTDF